jgi:hypothetical protein
VEIYPEQRADDLDGALVDDEIFRDATKTGGDAGAKLRQVGFDLGDQVEDMLQRLLAIGERITIGAFGHQHVQRAVGGG